MRQIIHIITIILIGAAIAGCGNSAEEQRRLSKAERDSLHRLDSAALKIGVMPTLDCLPIVVAERLRLYDTLDVSVHLRRYRAMSECRKALEMSLVEGAVIDTLLMVEMNKVEEGWLYEGMRLPMKWHFLTAKKARLTRFDQMGDKMIAADGHGMSYQLAQQANDSLGRKKQQAFIIQVEDLAVRTKMLQTANVDAALLPEPFATRAMEDGAKEIPVKQGKPYRCGVVAFRKNAMKSAERRKQQQLFDKVVSIANDSIEKYGRDNYLWMLQW